MSSSDQNMLHLAPGTVLQDYEIQSVLGKGGFAITYLAIDKNLSKQMVLKELLPDGIATRVDGHTVVTQTPAQADDFQWAVDSFLQEAKTLASFEHPNIVRVSRLFEDNGTAYIVMPFIQGTTLKEIIKAQAPMPQQRVLEIFEPILTGMEIVHAAGVLHRDIKPDNIFVTGEGVPVLIDFGAARQKVSGKSMDMTSVITPGYAPIEQYSTDSKFQGAWSDIYAIAAVVYEMITKIKPAAASERNDALRHQKPDPVKPLHQLADSSYSPAFLAGIEKALSLGENQRPQSIAEWKALLSLGNNQTQTPGPPPPMPPPVSVAPAYAQPTQSFPSGPPTQSGANISQRQKPSSSKKTTALIAVALLLVCGLGLAALVYFGAKDAPVADGDKTPPTETDSKTPVVTQPPSAPQTPPKPDASDTRIVKLEPIFTFEGGDVPTDCYALLEKYLRPANDRIPWSLSTKDGVLILETSKKTAFPIKTILEVPHMSRISIPLEIGRPPMWDLNLQSREVLVSRHPQVTRVSISLDKLQTQDEHVRKLVQSRPPKDMKWQPVANQRLLTTQLPDLACRIKVFHKGGMWQRVVRTELKYLVVGDKAEPNSSEDLRLAAERGDKEDQLALAKLYYDRKQFFNDYAWSYFAAMQKNKEAQHHLAAYFEGIQQGLPDSLIKKDQLLAQKWYQASADQKCLRAYFALGQRYHFGVKGLGGFAPNLEKASFWYEKIIDQEDHLESMNCLADILHQQAYGLDGIELLDAEKEKRAVMLWKKAALKGDERSMYDLGVFYDDKENFDQAVFYYKKSIQRARETKNRDIEKHSLEELKKLSEKGNQSAKAALKELE